MLVPVIALACSVVLLLQHKGRLLPVLAVIACCIELLVSAGIMHMSVAKVQLPLILGAILVVAGVFVYLKDSAKHVVASATVLAIIGLLQVATALNYRVL